MVNLFLRCVALALVVLVSSCDDTGGANGQADTVEDGTSEDLVDLTEDTGPDAVADLAEDTGPDAVADLTEDAGLDTVADLTEDVGPQPNSLTIYTPTSGGGAAVSSGYRCRLSVGGYPMSSARSSGYSVQIGAGAVINQ